MATGGKPLERSIQRSILAYLHARNIVVAHVPNGSVLAGGPRRRAMQMQALKLDGLRPGFPDLILLGTQGRIGFMEVKREGEKLGEAQIHWAGTLEFMGHKIATVRSIEDAAETLEKWGWV